MEKIGMSPNKLIVITGSIGTGKSTLASLLRKYGYVVLDCDRIAKKVLKKGGKSYKSVLEYFGKDILDPEGEIDSRLLGQKIFSDENERRQLDQLTHPGILEALVDNVKAHQGEKTIFLDIPLYYEWKEKIDGVLSIDEVWVVWVSKEDQLRRLMSRNALTEAQARDRIGSQICIDIKAIWADRVFDNSKSVEELDQALRECLEKGKY